MKIWLITLTIFTLIVAIFVGNLYCQGVPYDNNAAGFIVASLAVLVTVLVGWQVFTLVEIRGVLRRVEVAEGNLSKVEQRITEQIHKENADASMVHIFSLIRNLENNLNENHILEVRLIYGLSAETLKKQLFIKDIRYVSNCLQIMEIGVLFADRLNVWAQLFDEATTAVLNKTYNEIIPLTAPMTQEQKSRLLHIHDSRTSRQLHDTLRPTAKTASPA